MHVLDSDEQSLDVSTTVPTPSDIGFGTCIIFDMLLEATGASNETLGQVTLFVALRN